MDQDSRLPASRDPLSPHQEQHQEDQWLQHVPDSEGTDAPQVYEETGKEVKPEQEKEHYTSAVVAPDGPVATSTASRQAKILGFRRRTFYIALIVLILIIIGAVLGGVLGTRNSDGSGSGQGSGQAAGSSASSTSTTSSPTPAPSVAEKADFKFPSIALTGSGSPPVMKLFTLHSSNNTVTFHIRRSNSTWQALGAVSLNILPLPGAPLAAASWRDNGYDHVRLYYIDENVQLVELSARCQDTVDCIWNGEKSLVRSGVSNSSSLSVSRWGDIAAGESVQLRVYFSDEGDYLQLLTYDGSWNDPTTLGQSVGRGSGLASIADASNNTVERVFYTDANGSLVALRRTPGYGFTLTNAWFTDTALTPTLHNLATCLYPTLDLSTDYLVVRQIVQDGTVAEAFKDASGGDWTTGASADAISGAWARGDDVGGAIACTGWADNNDRSNQLLMYSVGGAMREYWLRNGTWTFRDIF